MASPTTPRYCKYFFSARGCNQGNDCKYLHQQMDEVRMELPCTALSIDIETTGCWPGVHKIVAIGVALFQLHPSHQVVELDRKLFQFKVNYPQDFDEITMRDFWHVQGRMELLEMLQNGAVEEEEAIKDFYDYYTEVCYRYPKFFLITDNPVMDLGFLNLSIATKLRKPPLTYRPVLRSPRDESASLRLTSCLGASLESASPSTSTSVTRSLSGLSETESDDELSTDGGEESDEDAFGESGEEDGADSDSSANASTATTGERLLAQASELAKCVQLQTPMDSNKKLASFYDDYSAPHFAIDLNSFACGLVGLHLPPFRRAGGSRWASPADFLSYHKPFLVCPYRKTHDPVDDASFNCWQFLQCISIVWMNEYAEIHQSRAKEELAASKPNASTNTNISINSGSSSPHQSNKYGNGAAAAAGGAKPTSPKPAYNDAEFPTIASANATSNDRKKQQQQQQRSPRRGRAISTLAVTPDKTALPSRGSGKQQAQRQPRQSPTSVASSPSNPHLKATTIKAPGAGPASSLSPSSQVQRRTARSHSDPPALTELTTCSNTAAAIAKASPFNPERTIAPRQQRSAVLF